MAVSLLPAAARREADQNSTVEQEFQAFAYIVSHDIAASIRHLSVFSRLLVDDLGEGLSARQRTYADGIRAAGEQSTAMLEQLLVFSRLQRRPLVKTLLDATAVVRLVLMRLSAEIEAAKAEIVVGPLGEVEADGEWLGLACTLLMDNALKFRRPGVAPQIVVEAERDKAFWRMRIRDNGIGVEPAFREAAFGMFRRLHGGQRFPGVGAGLAICRRIARQHGGDAKFLDCAEGACVELALPRAVRFPKPARRRKEIENDGADETAHG